MYASAALYVHRAASIHALSLVACVGVGKTRSRRARPAGAFLTVVDAVFVLPFVAGSGDAAAAGPLALVPAAATGVESACGSSSRASGAAVGSGALAVGTGHKDVNDGQQVVCQLASAAAVAGDGGTNGVVIATEGVNHDACTHGVKDVGHEVEGNTAQPVAVGNHNFCDISTQDGVHHGRKARAGAEVDAAGDVGDELVVWEGGTEVGNLACEVAAGGLVLRGDAGVDDAASWVVELPLERRPLLARGCIACGCCCGLDAVNVDGCIVPLPARRDKDADLARLLPADAAMHAKTVKDDMGSKECGCSGCGGSGGGVDWRCDVAVSLAFPP